MRECTSKVSHKSVPQVPQEYPRIVARKTVFREGQESYKSITQECPKCFGTKVSSKSVPQESVSQECLKIMKHVRQKCL